MLKMEKNKINNGITKQKYIFNRVPPEKVSLHLVQLSELVTTPSLNYTHLQNLTRSLAEKKKVVGTIICQDRRLEN